MIFSDQCFLKEQCKKFQRGDCPQNDFCIKLFKLDALYNLGLFSDFQRCYLPLHIDRDGTDKEEFNTLKAIESDIENFVSKGQNLYIYSSSTGTGKTSWGLRLAQAYLNSIWYKTDITCRVLFISVPKFYLALKDNISKKNDYIEHIKNNVLQADLVIWDDIATKVGTEFEIENMLNIIDNRIYDKKCNIYTSNMNPLQINQLLGSRLFSRIVNQSINICFHGTDKRGLQS